VTADIEVGVEVGEALIVISDQIERWDLQLRLFPTNERVFTSVAKLFAHTLHYLIKARLYLSPVYPGRALKAFLGSDARLRKIFGRIQLCASSLDSEISIASEASQSTTTPLCGIAGF